METSDNVDERPLALNFVNMMLQFMGDIEDIIKLSQEKLMAISLKVRGQEEAIVTSIERFINKGSLKLIELKPYTLYGKRIQETVIHLSEVEKAVPLFVGYDDPVYRKVREYKSRVERI